MYVVIAFPDREFALHMFTVSVRKAAVYLFFHLFSIKRKAESALPFLRNILGAKLKYHMYQQSPPHGNMTNIFKHNAFTQH